MITRIYRNGIGQRHRLDPRPQTIEMGQMIPNGRFGFGWVIRQSPDGKLWMANVFMNEAKTSIVNRNIDLIADTLKVALVSSTFVANADDQFIDAAGASDVVDARIAGTTDQTLGGKAIGKDTTGDFAYFDANDSTFTAVASGTVVAVVGYKSTGVDTTSKILGYWDIPDVVANGGDITIAWASAASGALLKLA